MAAAAATSTRRWRRLRLQQPFRPGTTGCESVHAEINHVALIWRRVGWDGGKRRAAKLIIALQNHWKLNSLDVYSVPLTADQNNERVYVELFALDNSPETTLFILVRWSPEGMINNELQKWLAKCTFLSLYVMQLQSARDVVPNNLCLIWQFSWLNTVIRRITYAGVYVHVAECFLNVSVSL